MNSKIQDLHFTSKLVKDYLQEKKELQPMYQHSYKIDNIVQQTISKQENYKNRNVFYNEICKQHQKLELSPLQQKNLELLQKNNTFTLTTGHQLNLMTGPLYTLVKVLQVIKTAETLNKKQNKYKYVPVFWMATEDHDFEEINHFKLHNQKIEFNTPQKGAVGRFKIEELKTVLKQFLSQNTHQINYQKVEKWIEQSYFNAKNWSEATFKLYHLLFKEYGLLIFDGDNHSTKKIMNAPFKEELLEQTSFKKITETNTKLGKLGYKIQVNPREINLFYLSKEGRNRIEKRNDGKFIIVDTPIVFSEEEILKELENHPQNFSPNALLRPFYQETIMPNVAYIGGNAEVAYWFELYSFFSCQNVDFPVLIPRNSVVFYSEKSENRMKKLSLDVNEITLPKHKLESKIVKHFSMLDLNLEDKKQEIKALYSELKEKSKQTDKTLFNLLDVQETRQLNAFDKVEKRLYKAEKRVLKQKINQLETTLETFFPSHNFQERELNFLHWLLAEDAALIQTIYNGINVEKSQLNFLKI